MNDLDSKLLRAFVSVAKSKSMTASAQETGQTQGAVSQQVKRLETLLGQKLFLRSGQGLSLTASGTQLVQYANAAIDACDDIFDHFRPDVTAKTVRFGMPYDLVSAFLSSTLDQFSSAFPEIDVDLHCEASPVLKEMVKVGDLDLAMVEEPVHLAKGDVLRMEPLVWIGKKGGRAHTKQPLPISLVAESCSFRPSIQAALEDEALSWRTVFENGDLNATMATVRSDMSVTAGLKSLVPPELTILPTAEGLPDLPNFAICLYPIESELHAGARELSTMIKRAFSPQTDIRRVAKY